MEVELFITLPLLLFPNCFHLSVLFYVQALSHTSGFEHETMPNEPVSASGLGRGGVGRFKKLRRGFAILGVSKHHSTAPFISMFETTDPFPKTAKPDIRSVMLATSNL